MGIGQPLDNVEFTAKNSFMELTQEGNIADAADCKSKCDNIASPTILKGFSFYDDGNDGTNNLCRCWTDGENDILSTDGDASFGNTYCYGCRYHAEQLSSQPVGQSVQPLSSEGRMVRQLTASQQQLSSSTQARDQQQRKMSSSLFSITSMQTPQRASKPATKKGRMLRQLTESQPSPKLGDQPWMKSLLHNMPNAQPTEHQLHGSVEEEEGMLRRLGAASQPSSKLRDQPKDNPILHNKSGGQSEEQPRDRAARGKHTMLRRLDELIPSSKPSSQVSICFQPLHKILPLFCLIFYLSIMIPLYLAVKSTLLTSI